MIQSIKKIYLLPALLLVAFAGTEANAQGQGQVYLQYTDIKVIDAAVDKVLAWCGGMNNPQPNMADLNHDGKMDLVVYEKDYGVKTFLNKGSAGNPDFVYEPYYQHTFPTEMQDYVKLVDYNRDGIMDLMHRGAPGFVVYRGYYDSKNELSFTYYKDLFYQTQFQGLINVYCEPSDIPSVVDVDNDGDLDFLSYYINGGFINFYRNCQVEEGLPKDSIKICLKDICWGKAFQSFYRTQQLGQSCSQSGTSCKGCEKDESANKTTHTGNALCIFDYDGDGDMDYMTGGVSFDDIQFVKNGRVEYAYGIDTMTWQDTSWSYAGKKPQMNLWPAPFAIDIDSDNDLDLLFAPHMRGTENYKSITYFKNNGATPPAYEFQSDVFLTDKMIDQGTASYPMFYDYDKDGKQDLFIGADGVFQGTGNLVPKMAYYKNTGTAQSPEFTLQNANFMALNVLGKAGAAPAVGDVNNDGKDDLVVGHSDGTLTLYLNNAANGGVQPSWVLQGDLKNDGNVTIKVDNYAAPCFYDLDKDGKKDLVIGCQQGTLSYYRNIGATPGLVTLKLENNKLGDIKIDLDQAYGYGTPYIGRIDNTGTDYLVMGSNTGVFYRFDGFQNGNTTNPYIMLDSVYSELKTDGRSAPAFTDLDGDNRYEMVSGNEFGGVFLYKQLFNVSVDDLAISKDEVQVYPNPAKDKVYINWQNSFAGAGNVHIMLTSVIGQKLVAKTVPARNMGTSFSTGDIAPGTYYCIIRSGDKKTVTTLTIVK